MTNSLARARDHYGVDLCPGAGPPRAPWDLSLDSPSTTTTLYRPFTGKPVEAEMLEAVCPRCRDVWEWPLGLDANLDRRAARGLVVDVCPSCLDDWADERAIEEGWA